MRRVNTIADIMKMVDLSQGWEGCQIWKGAKDKDGYGQVRLGGRTEQVHRVAFESYIGGPLPKGLSVPRILT